MTPQDFIAQWGPGGPAFDLNEEQGAQSHFIDLCELLGVPKPGSQDGYLFEKQTMLPGQVIGQTRGYADVFKRGAFAWENKAPGKNLDAALKQLLNYSSALNNPPILVVCDRLQIRVQTQFTGHPTEKFTVLLAELAEPDKLALLRRIWLDPESFRPKITSRDITEKAAKSFATLAGQMRSTGHDPQKVSHFLTQCLFCFFAEDVGLLPDRLFEKMINAKLNLPNKDGMLPSEKLATGLNALFHAMNNGTLFGTHDIDRFNGGLFKNIDVPQLDILNLTELRNAAALNWSAIDVSIFGTLFERGLDPAKRSQLGAHYTDPATIMRIIEPVLQRPLLQVWELQAKEIHALLAKSKRKNDVNYKLAQAKFVDWLNQLKNYRVLDPACGSGNFLFLGLKALKDIEHKSHLAAAALGLDREADLVTGPHNMLGIELNEYAAELARVTVWIGELQWRLAHGYEFKKNPVLEPLDNIECRDALLSFLPLPPGEKNDKLPLPSGEGRGEGSPARNDVTQNEARAGQTPAAHTLRFLKSPQMSAPPAPLTSVSGSSNLGSDPSPKGAGSDPNLRIQLTEPVEASWPWASIVIANPPFLGDKRMRSELGDDYTEALRKVYVGRVPGGADLVTFWFEKARTAIEKSGLGAAGLVATQSVRAGANRTVLARVAETARIYEAWSDEPWVNEGAAVRVSLVCFGWGGNGVILDGVHVPKITPDLADGKAVDLTLAKLLEANKGRCFVGSQKGGSFEVDGELARQWLRQPSVNGRSNSEVLRPWANGQDLTGRGNDQWIVDFGNDMFEVDASQFDLPFLHVVQNVRKARDPNREAGSVRYWWLHQRPRPEMRAAISGLTRYIATPRVAKHRFFVFLDKHTLADSRLCAIASDDDATFGILSSRLHEVWSLANASMHGVGNDPTYNARSCFETFPFPTSNRLLTRASKATIAAAAKRLNDLREAWLNPPDWADRIPEVTPLGMTSSPYPDRVVPKPGHEKDLAERTLTKLYNARPAWLDAAHKALDEHVAAAYGWADYTADMPDEEILKRLLALNLGRAALENS